MMHELMTSYDIENIFRPTFYLEVPASYIKEIKIHRNEHVTKFNTPQIKNTLMDKNGMVRMEGIYHDESVTQTEIDINFDLICHEINSAILQMHNEYIQKLGDG